MDAKQPAIMNINFLLFKIICHVWLCLSKPRSFIDDSSLYDSRTDEVIVLHAGNYMEIQKNTNGLLVVEYYASWCGHCISFSKIYKQLSLQLKFWGVYFAAINCANPVNAATCDSAGIHLYPTLKVL